MGLVIMSFELKKYGYPIHGHLHATYKRRSTAMAAQGFDATKKMEPEEGRVDDDFSRGLPRSFAGAAKVRWSGSSDGVDPFRPQGDHGNEADRILQH